jgi:ribosomal protein S14
MKLFGLLGGVSFEGLLGLFGLFFVGELDAVSDGREQAGCVAFSPPGLCGVEEFVGHARCSRTGSFGVRRVFRRVQASRLELREYGLFELFAGVSF